MTGQIIVHPSKESLAAASAARLITTVIDAQAERGEAHVVLTGGSMGSAILEALVATPAAEAIAWELVHLWWGDERFLPENDADRNATQAFQAGLAQLKRLGLDDSTIHQMAASDGPDGDDIEAAAQRYARALADEAAEGSTVPAFDVLMLGVGPDAHVASLFPGKDTLALTDVMTAAELDSPKPPPQRITLTYPAINAARQVWFLVSGEDKAAAVAAATGGASVSEAPAAGAHGTEATLWLIDESAAVGLPGGDDD